MNLQFCRFSYRVFRSYVPNREMKLKTRSNGFRRNGHEFGTPPICRHPTSRNGSFHLFFGCLSGGPRSKHLGDYWCDLGVFDRACLVGAYEMHWNDIQSVERPLVTSRSLGTPAADLRKTYRIVHLGFKRTARRPRVGSGSCGSTCSCWNLKDHL